MSLASLETTVWKNNGQLFDYGQNGLLVLDCTGQRITHVPRNHMGEIEAEFLDAVHSFFVNVNECCKKNVRILNASPNCKLTVVLIYYQI